MEGERGMGQGMITEPEVYTLDEFLAKHYPPRANIVGHGLIIEKGLTVTGAPSKVGKTILQMQLSQNRGAGEPWLGFPTTLGRTLYVNAEVIEERFQERWAMMREGHTAPAPGTVHVVSTLGHEVYLNTPEGVDRLRRYIEKACPDLVILDPLTHLLKGNESDPTEMQRFLHNLRTVRASYKLAISLVHHLRKPPRDPERLYTPSAHDLSGSSLLFREVDAAIIGHVTKDGFLQLDFNLRHAADLNPLVLQRGTDLWWHPTQDRPIPENLQRVLHLLSDRPLAHTDWKRGAMEAVGCSDATARRRIAEAVDSGFAIKTRDERYDLTPLGRRGVERSRNRERKAQGGEGNAQTLTERSPIFGGSPAADTQAISMN